MRLEDEPWSGSAQYLLGSARVYLSRHGDMPRYEKYLVPLRAATLSALQIVMFKPYERKRFWAVVRRMSTCYSRWPGTKMKSTMVQTPVKTVKNRTISARLFRSLRTYGSRMRDQFMNVYSLRPARASTGSMLYCCDEREYTPIVKGRISCIICY